MILQYFFRQYLWVDEKGKKSRLSAPQYIDYIMTYVQKTINDEGTFPTKHGTYLFWIMHPTTQLCALSKRESIIFSVKLQLQNLNSYFLGNDFPTTFDTHIRKIHRLLFHVLAHIYHSHFKEILLLQLHAHLNAVFVHFVEFNLRFHTVDEKELEVTISYLYLY